MNPSYVEKRVKEILTQEMGDAAPKEINNRMLLSYLEFDELSVTELVMRFEEEFEMEMEEAEFNKCVIVQDLIDLITGG
ncbi:phosphopantetheine-binding protein [Streptomyces sp. IBSBF 2806]|uniref:phosphopantetheine-binding protein n=1 Tax=Streptomyces sp. IBSBF 2806 TaxID=2903529 RepID=UPI002FDBE3F7